jgi:hypothetical protein
MPPAPLFVPAAPLFTPAAPLLAAAPVLPLPAVPDAVELPEVLQASVAHAAKESAKALIVVIAICFCFPPSPSLPLGTSGCRLDLTDGCTWRRV